MNYKQHWKEVDINPLNVVKGICYKLNRNIYLYVDIRWDIIGDGVKA